MTETIDGLPAGRGTLFRTSQELAQDGSISVESVGAGKRPGTHRKAATAPA